MNIQDFFLIVVRNALHVPSMEINLIPPFILREAGITVNDKLKIHASDPSSDDHAIIFENNGLKIPLKLNEIFSYFDTSKPTENQVQNCDDMYLLTLEHNWKPHTDVYAKNEENMLDWEENIKIKQDRVRVVLEDIDLDPAQVSAATISRVETNMVDSKMQSTEPFGEHRRRSYNEVSPIYDPERLYTSLYDKAQDSHFKIPVASTTIHKSEHLWEDDEYYDTDNDENEYQSQSPDIMSDDDQSDTDQI